MQATHTSAGAFDQRVQCEWVIWCDDDQDIVSARKFMIATVLFVLNGMAGTSGLTRIRNGSQVRFLLEEVLQLMRRQEQNKNLSIRDLQAHQTNGQSHTPTL
jgi:hypothetical protein